MPHNIIIFGETGAGKSSIVNMLNGDETAAVNNGAHGVTFQHKSYDKRILDSTYKVFDTVGLNEGTKEGTVTAAKAIVELYALISQLDDGVSLLVYVMRAPRITVTRQKNYELFQTLCDRAVPMVMVVTGLEDMDDMGQWWSDNKHAFHQCNMRFADVACITATRGKKRNWTYVYEAEYAYSKDRLEELIAGNHSSKPWRMERQPWFARAAVNVHNTLASMLRFKPIVPFKLREILQRYSGLTKEELKTVLVSMST